MGNDTKCIARSNLLLGRGVSLLLVFVVAFAGGIPNAHAHAQAPPPDAAPAIPKPMSNAAPLARAIADGGAGKTLYFPLMFRQKPCVQPLRVAAPVTDTTTLAPSFTVQRPFDEIKATINSLAIGDLDGDGDLDMVGAKAEQSVIYLNNGASNFTLVPLGNRGARAVSLGDLDGDGDLDVVAVIISDIIVTNAPQRITLFRNNGSGQFTADSAFGDGSNVLVLGDMDGDGDLDIVTKDQSAQGRIYLNDGLSHFTVATQAVQAFAQKIEDVALGDMDGDGDLDVVASAGNDGVVYFNDGISHFVRKTVIVSTSRDSFATWRVGVGDIDGDGDLDVVISGYDFGIPDILGRRMYFNDGRGNFGKAQLLESYNEGTDVWASSLDFAIADVDGDGDLDTAESNLYASTIHFNDGQASFKRRQGFGKGSDKLYFGDMDGDGDLDAVTISPNWQSTIYLNNGLGNFGPAWVYTSTASPGSVFVGDIDGDGDLDVVKDTDGFNFAIYTNNGSGVFGLARSYPNSVRAIADVDADGDLDVVGSSSVYLNNGLGILKVGYDLRDKNTGLGDIATGDMDGDGDLDIVSRDRVLLNDGFGDFSASIFFDSNSGTVQVAVGDIDGDGDLDIVAGSLYVQNHIYLNDGSAHFESTKAFGSYADVISDLALGDLDDDGDLDLVAARYNNAFSVYFNDGSGGYGIARDFAAADTPEYLTLGDMDGDGDLDIAAVGDNGQSAVYLNEIKDGLRTFDTRRIFGPKKRDAQYSGGSWDASDKGDLDGDGSLDIVINLDGNLRIFFNSAQAVQTQNQPVHVTIQQLGRTRPANLFSSAELFRDPVIPIPYILCDRDNDAARQIKAYFSLDGGGRWLPAVGTSGTLTQNLSASSTGLLHTFNWDTSASGVFGVNDSVVFRIEAYPSLKPAPNNVPVFQRHYFATQTFPFRVRGTLIHVMNSEGTPAPSAFVYRLKKGQVLGGTLFVNNKGQSLRTNTQGYLQGRGALATGDQLLALVPLTSTGTYTLYATNGTPTKDGIKSHLVSAAGVQTLTVSAAHPLYLFDLKVALEWDARQDLGYLDQLSFNLKRASQLLYDFTDGQMALGNVTVVQNGQDVDDANIVIRANDRLRPYAVQGGVVTTPTVDPGHSLYPSDIITYSPGQITMGATWNRYGLPGQSLGEDWSLVLAHELSHYLLYQDEAYLGLDNNGYLTAIDSCTGSAMGDLYGDAGATEFIFDEAFWASLCKDTLAFKTLRRTEWQTAKLWYPALNVPTQTLSGPTLMPFDLTTVTVLSPTTQTDTLADPSFYIDYVGGLGSSGEARAYVLKQNGKRIVDLGSPLGGQNRVLARSAEPGDRLCVFDQPLRQLGCESIARGDERLQMLSAVGWDPVIQLTPVNSVTLAIRVEAGIGTTFAALKAQLFPGFSEPSTEITLTANGSAWVGTFPAQDKPPVEGHVRLWSNTSGNSQNEMIVPYSMGGDPGKYRRATGKYRRATGPSLSPDGQLILYINPSVGVQLEEGQLYVVQSMSGLPARPSGRTVIGQGYNVVTSPGTPIITGSVSIQYLRNEVLLAGAEESQLAIYYYGDLDKQWVELATVLDAKYHLATAASRGAGIYALMARLPIPLLNSGWNVIAYPILEARAVTQALSSIAGFYTTVYGFNADDKGDPWKIYDVLAPAYVNDLKQMEYGHSYWISATQPVTLYLGLGEHGPAIARRTASLNISPSVLPFTLYGNVTASPGFTPTANLVVKALIDGKVCGETTTTVYDEQIVYALNVLSDSGGDTVGCGVAGRVVQIQAGATLIATPITLNNNGDVVQVPL